jgi:hypothetical protein
MTELNWTKYVSNGAAASDENQDVVGECWDAGAWTVDQWSEGTVLRCNDFTMVHVPDIATGKRVAQRIQDVLVEEGIA